MPDRPIKGIVIQYGIVLTDLTVTQDHINQIQEAAPEAELFIIKSPDDLSKHKEAISAKGEVVYGLRPGSLADDMPHLKWMQQTGAGADWLESAPKIVESDLVLTNASGVHAIPIAEHILAFMFSFARLFHRNIRSQTKGKWERGGQVVELDGATLGVAGVGKIGSKTAEKAKALNMRVLGLRRNPDIPDVNVDKMFGPDELDNMLAQCDWVAITAAMTPETRGMFGLKQFQAMKNTAVVINIARGSVIVEDELIKALETGLIAGAGLDVFEREPLPEDSSLWNMDNVIITPHYAGATPNYVDRLMDIFITNIGLYRSNREMINVVDKKLGY